MDWLNVITSVIVFFAMLGFTGIVFILSNIESFIDWLNKKGQ